MLGHSSLEMVIDARTNFGSSIFREICITACWVIWTTRNTIIFDNGQISVNGWMRRFKEELGQVCTKANSKRQTPLTI
jgi:Fe-S cluster biosynthesis and repair protein YggX